MSHILVTEPLAPEGLRRLQEAGHVEQVFGLPEEQLAEALENADALVVRSATQVTARVLSRVKRLKVIGRAGVGVDNIDVEAATARGVLVVNSPHGNTTAAAELTIALMLSLARRIPQADAALRAGRWERKQFVGTEVYGKTLGIIGLGRIGMEVARRGRALGMEVIAYDPYVNPALAEQNGIKLRDMPGVLAEADFLSLHAPLTDQTRGMIGANELACMKDGVRIINCARGGLIDEQALAAAIRSGKVAGAALDVFAQEPVSPDNPLVRMSENVVTPHLGASTAEAQVAVAVDIAEQVVDVLQGRPPRSPVNMPHLTEEAYASVRPYLELGQRMGSLLAQLIGQDHDQGFAISEVEVWYAGDFGNRPTHAITRAVLAGLLTPILSEPANLVNAPMLAAARGISVLESQTSSRQEYSSLVTVTLRSGAESYSVSGTAFGPTQYRIVELNGYEVTFVPAGILLLTQHADRPGMIGAVGTLLGEHNVNIAGMDLGRKSEGGPALMVLAVDDPISPPLLEKLRGLRHMQSARVVTLDPVNH